MEDALMTYVFQSNLKRKYIWRHIPSTAKTFFFYFLRKSCMKRNSRIKQKDNDTMIFIIYFLI